MKTSVIGIVILFGVLLVVGNAIPLEADKQELKNLEVKAEVAKDLDTNNEALTTANNFGIGYYPLIYDGLQYDSINRPNIIGYRSGYGSYGTQWSQYSRYNDYRGYRVYDGYYGRPFYPVWG